MPSRDANTLSQQIQAIAAFCYTPENNERARYYLTRRGLDIERFEAPPTHTGSELIYGLQAYQFSPWRITDALLIPITSIVNPQRLVAFDCRYNGADPSRPRYQKFKNAPPEPLVYGIHRAIARPHGQPIILTEGAIDAESISQATGYAAISYLTALAVPSVVALIAALTDTCLLALDNDEDGTRTANKLFTIAAAHRETATLFVNVNYRGKDPNRSLMEYGSQELQQAVGTAMEQAILAKIRPFQDVFTIMSDGVEQQVQLPVVDPFI